MATPTQEHAQSPPFGAPMPAADFTPVLLLQAYPPFGLEQFFIGRPPKVGDAVEMVCYDAGPTHAKLAWRVVGETATEFNPTLPTT
jgi:hypothetical protein